MEIIGYISAILIGVSLGLMGGGGSILTVPVMVYFLGVSPILSTTYSLFVVGITSFVGVIAFVQKKLVNYRAAIVFAIPSFLAVILARAYVLPKIPYTINVLGLKTFTKDAVLLILFSCIMIVASYFMIKKKQYNSGEQTPNLHSNQIKIGFTGFAVGFISGIVGAGGGFIIIPALVLFANLPMKMAVGTSLLIISSNSIIGFSSGLKGQVLNWSFLVLFTALSVLGIYVGSKLSTFINGEVLKKGFGFFILVIGVVTLLLELM